MKQLARKYLEHWHVVAVVTVLTLVLTFPTIIYVFMTDVFWLPTGDSRDIYIQIWDMWYGNLVLTGQADRYFTDLIFYPEGVSLVSHPIFFPQVMIVNALMAFLPLSNAFNLSILLMIWITTLSTYVYTLYLFKEKWLALFGAVLLGFSPQALSHYNHPSFMFMAPLPLCLYFFHRGVNEKQWTFLIVSGLCVGLTSDTNLYLYVCIMITLGLGILAFAVGRWRDGVYWRLVAVLILTIGVWSLWRLYPLISNSQSLSEAMTWHGESERNHDLISYFVNYSNSFARPIFESIIKPPEYTNISAAAYLGILPLFLIGLALSRKDSRRRIQPWLFLLLLFFLLSLGSTLIVNGSGYPGFPLPKPYLNRLFPTIFLAFNETEHFIMGMVLPLAVSATWGFKALQKICPAVKRPVLVLLFIAVVAFEYYVPVEGNLIGQDQFAFLEWLAREEDQDIRLINAPLGRHDAKRNNLYQALSGYPSAEGAISRTPEAAFAYIYANPILGAWRDDRPTICGFNSQDEYLTALGQLEDDGFTHVVFHRRLRDANMIAESFSVADPSYSDEYVSIYRIGAFKGSCPREFIRLKMSEAHAAKALLLPSVIHERHGAILGFQRDLPADELYLRYISQATFDRKSVISISVDENDEIAVLSSMELFRELDAISAVNDAIWLVNNPLQTDLQQLDIYVNWFTTEYRFCQRYLDDESGTIDLYVRPEIPCAAGMHSREEILYDNGIRLINFAVDVDSEQLTFFLSWITKLDQTYSFSVQILDAEGERVLQYDDTIARQPLSMHQVDHALPSGSELTVILIVYDYDTGKSEGGTALRTMERFDRELEVAKIKV
ncbi:MAG: hypothetical protein OXG78_14705 [Chloroflexi bacterium]|nr:hypothetical protein [Chloroflexota bacterium]